MRVVHLTTSFPVDPDGISGIFIRELVDHLPASVHNTVVTPQAKFSALKDQPRDSDNWQLVRVRYAPTAWQTLAHAPGGIPATLDHHPWYWGAVPLLVSALFFKTLALARRADLLHGHWSVNGAIAGIAGLVTATPVITTLRGADMTWAQTSPVGRLVLQIAVGLSRVVTTVSEEMAQVLWQRFPERKSRIHLVRNGIHPEFFASSEERGHRISGSFKVVTVGSLIPRKSVHTLIQAMAVLDRQVPCEVTIIGDGPERDRVLKLSHKLGVSDRVEFLGSVAPAQVPRHLHEADVFVLTSLSEGRPNALMEAMAAGMPVIASDIAGVRELVTHGRTGLLFEPGNSQQLSLRLKSLERDPGLCRQLGSQARSELKRLKLTWTDCANRYAQLYGQATSSPVRR